MVTINELAHLIMKISNKNLSIEHIKGPEGVRGRNSDNHLIHQKLGWKPKSLLIDGLEETYSWINQQVEKMLKKETY